MRERGLEPPLGCPNQALNLARLPIPPFPQAQTRFYTIFRSSQVRAEAKTALAPCEKNLYHSVRCWYHRRCFPPHPFPCRTSTQNVRCSARSCCSAPFKAPLRKHQQAKIPTAASCPTDSPELPSTLSNKRSDNSAENDSRPNPNSYTPSTSNKEMYIGKPRCESIRNSTKFSSPAINNSAIKFSSSSPPSTNRRRKEKSDKSFPTNTRRSMC